MAELLSGGGEGANPNPTPDPTPNPDPNPNPYHYPYPNPNPHPHPHLHPHQVEILRATGWTLTEPHGAPPLVRGAAADGSQRVEILRRCEFDHVSMTMSVVARLADGGLRCFCKGAPEALAKRCDPASLPADYAAIAAAHALQGYYVLGLAAKEPGPLSEVS